MDYISRALEAVLLRAVSQFPAVVLTGPRQAGKTTLLRKLLPHFRYVSLEPPDVRAAAHDDARAFLAAAPAPAIIDEVQYAPDLLSYIKFFIDENRSRKGQYIVTGSQNLLLAERVTESLAGRAAILRLAPLTVREIAGHPDAPLPWEPSEPRTDPPRPLWPQLVRGFYPELNADPDIDSETWHSSYLQTYLERDVRTIRQVGDLLSFQSFLRMLAARSAQLLNATDLSRDLGVAVNTVRAWIAVLEATHQIVIVRPYFENAGKRLVKTPKIYFMDTGMLCHLTGWKDPAQAALGPLAGPIFETAVVTGIAKTFMSRGQEPRIYFWRTSSGSEVDLLVDLGPKLIPIEIKATSTPRPSMGDSIRRLREDLGERVAPGYVVHAGDHRLPLGTGVEAIPFSAL